MLVNMFKSNDFHPLDSFINIETLLEVLYHSRNYENPSSEIWTHIENNRAMARWTKSTVPGFSIDEMCDQNDSGLYDFISIMLDDFLDKSHQLINQYVQYDLIAERIIKVLVANESLYLVVDK